MRQKFSCWSNATRARGVHVGAVCWCTAPDNVTNIIVCWIFCLLLCNSTQRFWCVSAHLPMCTVATAVEAMCQYCGTVTVCHSNPHCHYMSADLPICTVATVQLLYAIRTLTVTISVHTVTNMYVCHSTVTVWHSNPHCHYISAHCYQYVR